MLLSSQDMSIIKKAANAFVLLATADDEMQDWWIPDEEWVHHIQSKEYLKPYMVISLNFGISRRFQFYNDRYGSVDHQMIIDKCL